jgi:hypothetical protein
MREAEFESVRKELAELNQKATASIADMNKAASFDPAAMIRDEVTKAAEPMEHLPAPTTGDIGASEVALSAPAVEPKPVEPAGTEAPKSSAAE